MNGWTESAEAWIASQGDEGDPSRRFVTDPAVRMLLAGRRFSHMLDVGCGEGRFCRLMKPQCARTTGIDPTVPLIDAARRLDPDGDYVIAGGEALPFADAAFDLVASYLSLGDIPDYRAAISEMARVLAPGGTLLVYMRRRDEGSEASGPPWPLMPSELEIFSTMGFERVAHRPFALSRPDRTIPIVFDVWRRNGAEVA